MIRISAISWMILAIYTIVGCSASQSNMATEKLSIKEKLQENNNLSIEEKIALYHRLKKKKTTTYSFEKEAELAEYGQVLLDNDLIEEAIEIFKLNSEQFPNSPKVYDNLSKAYMYR
jgi:predicted Zn-dependent protease